MINFKIIIFIIYLRIIQRMFISQERIIVFKTFYAHEHQKLLFYATKQLKLAQTQMKVNYLLLL